MVATRGPVPKRSEDRIRRNKPDGLGVTKGTMRPVTIPRPDPKWHPIAKRLYKSMSTSGQADFMQNSDWALAYSLCDDLSRYKREEDSRARAQDLADKWWSLTREERIDAGLSPDTAPHVPKGGSAMKLQSIYSALDRLMVTEADRRRLRIELQEPTDDVVPAEQAVMDEYRRALAQSG